jgi:hypothetical protein
MTNARCTVRPAQAGDVPAIFRMLRDLAAARQHRGVVGRPENLRVDGFERTPPRFQCLLAEFD